MEETLVIKKNLWNISYPGMENLEISQKMKLKKMQILDNFVVEKLWLFFSQREVSSKMVVVGKSMAILKLEKWDIAHSMLV